MTRLFRALFAAGSLLLLAACGDSDTTAVLLSVDRPSTFADYSAAVTATATVVRNGAPAAGQAVSFQLTPGVTPLSPVTGLSTDGSGQARVRFKRLPVFSATTTATVTARSGAAASATRPVTFLRPAAGTNLLVVAPDPAAPGRFLLQGFGLGRDGAPGVTGIDVTLLYGPPVAESLITVSPAAAFDQSLSSAATPGEVRLAAIAVAPTADAATLATVAFPAGSGVAVTGAPCRLLDPFFNSIVPRVVIVAP